MLVGREGAMGQARLALDEARAGHGQLLLVTGEAGIGKSAFVAALADEAVAVGVPVAWGFCWESEGVPPFWPWTQALRSLGLALPEAPDRFQLFDEVTLALRGAAPLAIILEDLQWADEPSLLLAEFIARQLPSLPLLLVGTYRDAEANPLLTPTHAVRLDGLEAADVQAVMAAVAGRQPPAALVDEVLRRTAGNPLFVREVTRLGVDPSSVPETVRAVLERRLARLSAGCRDLLTTAAIVGGDVRPEVLARFAGDVVPALDEGVRSGVLSPAADPLGPHRFTHDLYRACLQASVPPAERAARHLAAGRALAELWEHGVAIHPSELAAHFARAASAGGAGEAVRWSVAAAEEALAALAWEEAVVHYERALTALELADPPDAGQAADLLIGLGTARNRSGNAAGALNAFSEAGRLARQLDPAEGCDRLGRAALGVHELGAATGGAHAEQIQRLEEAARALAGERSALAARVLAALARDLHHSWTAAGVARAPAVALEAVALARDLDDPSTLSVCLLALHDARWTRASAPARLEVVDELMGVAVAAADGDLQAQAHLLRAAALLELCDPEGRTELRTYCRMAAELGHARGRWGALSRRAADAQMDGRVAEAAALSNEAFALGQQIGEPDAAAVWVSQRFADSRLRPGEARATFARGAVEMYRPMFQVIALADDGRTDDARAALGGFTLDDLPFSPDDRFVILAADALAAVGSDRERARAYDALLPLSGLQVLVGGCAVYAGPIDLRLGLLAAALGRRAAAAVHMAAAAQQCERLGVAGWVERTDAGDDGPGFSRDGDVWTLTFASAAVTVRDSKGLRDLAALVARPGELVHVFELVGTPGRPASNPAPTLDDRAKAAYRARLADLESDIDEAEAAHDPARAERARVEREALIAELSRAFGLGGRARRLGDEQERARKAVTARVRDALRRIDGLHPALGAHLRATVRTGAWCSYTRP